jgi:two-component system response regulator (stage 0 sporulation protein F)
MNFKNSEKGKVLIAEDEDVSRKFLACLLQLEGWEVSQAQDGQEAIEKFLQSRPNLLVLDYQMPALTGTEVYQFLRLNGIKLPVVLISGDCELEKIASSAGITYYLQKPFSIEEFVQTINLAYAGFIK